MSEQGQINVDGHDYSDTPRMRQLIDEQEAREVLAMIEEIGAATPEISWNIVIPGKVVVGSMTLPHDNLITGILSDGEDVIRRMYINVFQTNKRLQKRGIGTRLLKSLTATAKKYGASTLSGHVTSISALKTRIGVFGWDKLRFYSHASGEPISLTQEEALGQNPDWNVLVNLSEVDTTNWELPLEK